MGHMREDMREDGTLSQSLAATGPGMQEDMGCSERTVRERQRETVSLPLSALRVPPGPGMREDMG